MADELSVTDTDMQRAFDAISGNGPWLIGAAIEITGFLRHLRYKDRARLHSNLQLKRLRSGTNSLDAAELVQNGTDRSEASKLWSTYRQSGSMAPFSEWVEDNQLEDDQ